MKNSAGILHQYPKTYIHHGATAFDSGLKLDLLQEYWLIALDVFREFPYPKDKSEQTAWLSLLATGDMADAKRLVEEYPWLEEIYREMGEYMSKPEEVLNMFSEALQILDRNTVQYMIEEQLEQIVEQSEQIEEQQRQIAMGNARILEQAEQISQRDEQLFQKDEQLSQKDEQLSQKDEQLSQKDEQIDSQKEQIESQLKEIARLKKLVGEEP